MNFAGRVRISRNSDRAGHARQRRSRAAIEMSYDVITWVIALTVARLAAGDLSSWPAPSARAGIWLAAVCITPPVAGLLAGQYRSRRQRGSLDEIVGVLTAAVLSASVFAIIGQFIAPSHMAAMGFDLVALGIAMPAMLAGRFVLVATRQRPRARASASAVNVIVFGAGMRRLEPHPRSAQTAGVALSARRSPRRRPGEAPAAHSWRPGARRPDRHGSRPRREPAPGCWSLPLPGPAARQSAS